MTLPFVSVVVITKNNARTVDKCLNELLNQDYPKDCYEIVFVDGYSSDGTDTIVKKCAEAYPMIKFYYENHGTIGYARNVGIDESSGDIITFIDGDAYPPRNWITRIVEAFRNDSSLAIFGGLDILVSDNDSTNSGYSVMDTWRRLKKRVGITAIPCIKTVNFAARRSVILASGGFDKTLSYWEEPELLSRLYMNMGIENILYDPGLVVYHRRPSSSLGIRIRKIFKKSVVGVPVFLRKHVIRVATANPTSPLATNFYMILVSALGVPLLVFLVLSGLLMYTLMILLPAFLILIGVYTLRAYQRTKRSVWVLPATLILDSAVRLAGTFFGLVEWVFNSCRSRWRKGKT